MHCPTTKFINNSMITIRATVISRAATARTARSTMRENPRVSPSRNLLVTTVARKSICDKRITTTRTKWACNKAIQNLQDREGAYTADGDNVRELSADDWSMHSTTSTSSRNLRSGNINRRNQEHTQKNDDPRPSWSQHFQQPKPISTEQ